MPFRGASIFNSQLCVSEQREREREMINVILVANKCMKYK
jgi:hypothetical protein